MEQSALGRHLQAIKGSAGTLWHSYEVIVVDDASTDAPPPSSQAVRSDDIKSQSPTDCRHAEFPLEILHWADRLFFVDGRYNYQSKVVT